MLRKPLNELTRADLLDLIARGAEEDVSLEFKERLSAKDGADDPWTSGEGRIGNPAKRDLAKELVAFANTDGGVLVLGMKEDGSKRAVELSPIPMCRDLADRLCASMIVAADPPLISLDAVGIELDEKAGVVVFRVPPSYLAPHRSVDDKECYRRQGAASVPMSMREVREMAVERNRAAQQIDRVLDERSAAFTYPDQVHGLQEHVGFGLTYQSNVGVRAAAYPLERLVLDGLADRRDLQMDTPELAFRYAGSTMHVAQSIRTTWQPILRGMRAEGGGQNIKVTRILRQDGLIELSQVRPERLLERGPRGLPLSYVLWTFASLLIAVEATRTRVGRPHLPFALDFDWRFGGTSLLVPDTDNGQLVAAAPTQPACRISDHEMPLRDKLPQFWERLQEEILSSFGLPRHYAWAFDFDKLLGKST